MSPDDWSPVDVFREGDPDVPPVFFVPGGAGRPDGLEEISESLDPAIGVIGLLAPGADGSQAKVHSIEELAELFFQAIRKIQPKGPYRLVGYSAGGLICVEIGLRLRALGEEFEPLIFLDCLAGPAIEPRLSIFRKLWLARKWPPSYAASWLIRFLRARRRRRIGLKAVERVDGGQSLSEAEAAQRMVVYTLKAIAKYDAPIVDFDVVLFRASYAGVGFLAAGDALGWDRGTTGDVEVHVKKCDHVTMLESPIANEIGREINDILAVKKAAA